MQGCCHVSSADLRVVVGLQGKSKLFGDIQEEEHLLCPICMDRPLQVSVAACSHQVSSLSCDTLTPHPGTRVGDTLRLEPERIC